MKKVTSPITGDVTILVKFSWQESTDYLMTVQIHWSYLEHIKLLLLHICNKQIIWMIFYLFRTAAIAIILSLYLANFKMPIPVWTRKKGCHVIRYPLHQVFAVCNQDNNFHGMIIIIITLIIEIHLYYSLFIWYYSNGQFRVKQTWCVF